MTRKNAVYLRQTYSALFQFTICVVAKKTQSINGLLMSSTVMHRHRKAAPHYPTVGDQACAGLEAKTVFLIVTRTILAAFAVGSVASVPLPLHRSAAQRARACGQAGQYYDR